MSCELNYTVCYDVKLCMIMYLWLECSTTHSLLVSLYTLDELPVGQGQTEKADMRIVQAASQEVLSKHGHILSRGLMVNLPSVQQALDGEIPIIRGNTKQVFLTDFIESKAGTPGGRLARWE